MTFSVPIEKSVLIIDNVEKKQQKLYPTDQNSLIAQDFFFFSLKRFLTSLIMLPYIFSSFS